MARKGCPQARVLGLVGVAAITALQARRMNCFSVWGRWELSIKSGLTKLKLSLPFRQWMEKAITDLELRMLPLTLALPNGRLQWEISHGLRGLNGLKGREFRVIGPESV